MVKHLAEADGAVGASCAKVGPAAAHGALGRLLEQGAGLLGGTGEHCEEDVQQRAAKKKSDASREEFSVLAEFYRDFGQ